MPLVTKSNYKPPSYMFHGHLETILPYLVRKVEEVPYERERIELPDTDFLDVDWIRNGSDRLLILCHGLEGSSESQYMLGMARASMENGYDVLAINFRSCSGEMNRLLRMYHHGEIEDLTFLIEYVNRNYDYASIHLAGYSLGGNVILKYLGLTGPRVPLNVRSAMAVSVPCDLGSSSDRLSQWYNFLYTRRFMRSLKKKFDIKNQMFPGVLDLSGYHKVTSWREFDDRFTTKITSFASAAEYYDQGSANNFLQGIRTNTLLINAKNDPFLDKPSFPYKTCENQSFVFLETPDQGGHVGFWSPGQDRTYTEVRAFEFFEQYA